MPDIDSLYAAFADERRPATIDASPLRDSRGILQDLTSAPLRQLGADAVGPYASYAMTTVGTERDYRYFLPRILELSLAGTGWPGFEPELIAGKLVYGHWHEWSEVQICSLTEFFHVAFEKSLGEDDPSRADPGSWLAAAARLELDVDRCLSSWRSSPSPPAVLALADFVVCWTSALEEGQSFPPFWDEVSEPLKQVVRDWVFSGATIAQLGNAVASLDDDDLYRIDAAMTALTSGPTVRH